MTVPSTRPALVLACGALARELTAIIKANNLNMVIECLPGELHNRPDSIPAALEARLDRLGDEYSQVLIGYADCGTGGAIDSLCERRGLSRLPGAHCYELFAGSGVFANLHNQEPGTFYLTDYLAKHFDRLVVKTLGLDRHPELHDLYFANYRRLVLLSQTDEPSVLNAAWLAADRLGLSFEHRHCGYGGLQTSLVNLKPRLAAAL